MSFRYPAGLITASSPVNANYPSGVWTPQQALPYLQNGVWGQDQYFDQTVLLLHGDGTNGAQNNTFLDSSTNNFTITRNGNTTQGTFSPFSVGAGEWSNYFDGSGDNLATSATLGSGDFTLEFWFYPLSVASGLQLTGSYSSLSTGHWIMWGAAGNKITLYNGPALEMTLNINAWNHICWVRSSGTSTWYHNGVSVSSAADTTNWAGTGTLYIGGGGTANNTNGYISNYRLVKGVAIVPPSGGPTSPLTAVSGTDYLTCQSNRFVDNSSSPKTITRNGDVRVTPFSPFAPSAAYDPAVNGGSGYFDGTGDYLSSPNNSAIHVLGSDFCLEGWFYLNTAQSNRGLYSTYAFVGGVDIGYFIRLDTTFFRFFAGSAFDRTYTFTQGQWYHFAVTNSGGTGRIFINGEQQGATFSITATTNSTQTLQVGQTHTTTNSFNGYLSSFRIVKGSPVYTSNFTPPTSPPTAITNTSLLLNFTNAGIFDNTGKNNLETVGNAQIDTAVVKYGTGSMEFDGTGDYLVPSGDTNNFVFGTGDFTIEFWLRLSSTQTSIIYDQRQAGTQGLYPELYVNSNSIRYYTNSADRIVGSTLSSNQWYHIALVRSSGSTKLYVDGAQTGSTYADTNNYINGTNRPIVGAGAFTAGQDAMTGFIDDLRITKGIARYTANFTPPIARFPNQ